LRDCSTNLPRAWSTRADVAPAEFPQTSAIMSRHDGAHAVVSAR
jgi:hypothetical protein